MHAFFIYFGCALTPSSTSLTPCATLPPPIPPRRGPPSPTPALRWAAPLLRSVAERGRARGDGARAAAAAARAARAAAAAAGGGRGRGRAGRRAARARAGRRARGRARALPAAAAARGLCAAAAGGAGGAAAARARSSGTCCATAMEPRGAERWATRPGSRRSPSRPRRAGTKRASTTRWKSSPSARPTPSRPCGCSTRWGAWLSWATRRCSRAPRSCWRCLGRMHAAAPAARPRTERYGTRREAARVVRRRPVAARRVRERRDSEPRRIGDILAEDRRRRRAPRRRGRPPGTPSATSKGCSKTRACETSASRSCACCRTRCHHSSAPCSRGTSVRHAHARESATDGGEEPHAIRDPELAEITRAIGEGAVAATPAEAADLCRVRAALLEFAPEPPMHSRTNEASPEETRKETRLDELLRCLGDSPAALAIRQADVDGRLAALADDRVRELVARLLSLGRSEGNVADKVLAVDVLNEAFEWDAKGLDAAAACLPVADALLLRAHANTPDAEARRLAALGAMVAERVRAFEAGPRHNPPAQRARGRGSPAASSASRAKSSTPEYEDMIAEELRALLGSEEWTPARAGKLMAMLPAGRCMRLVAELDLGGPTAAIANRELRALAKPCARAWRTRARAAWAVGWRCACWAGAKQSSGALRRRSRPTACWSSCRASPVRRR